MTSHLRSSRAHLLVLGTALALIAQPALAQVHGDPTDLPILSAETPRGDGVATPGEPIAPVAKTVDGDISDWVGDISRYGGTAIYSAGEYVYQDHVFDAYGPDDGRDARRLAQTDPIEEEVPGFYRVDALAQADAAGELGIDLPEEFKTSDHYGNANSHADGADFEEVRVAADADHVYLLARTTSMSSPTTGLLVLADTQPGTTEYEVPFDAGISTTTADVAVFLNGSSGTIVDLATNTSTALPDGSVATNADGFTNAIEARLPLAQLASPEGLTLAVAAGTATTAGTGFAPLVLEAYADSPPEHANIANVAFRFDEPSRVWFEMNQALKLYQATIDPFFTSVDLAKLGAGTSETYEPGPGYHDRIFISDSTPGVTRESGRNGLFQHYGVYLPEAYDGQTQLPLQWWLHWRGGKAHTAAAVIPKMFKQYGEDENTIVVSPSGRGTSQWYVGTGHVDFLEVWKDVMDTYEVDRDHVYVSGHSMGGFGSFLLTVLYPDRFAAGVPVSPPVTQGAWTGIDFGDMCDEWTFEEYSFCYIQANQGNARAQHTRKLLGNLRHVPLAIFAGVQDELVPFLGVARQAEQLTLLGYRHRLYANVVAEHYTPPVLDQWAEVAEYEHTFTRPENPAQVTYMRDMPFERATELSRSENIPLSFTFDSAYWMSELHAPDSEAEAPTGVASFDGRSLAISAAEDQWAAPHLTLPDSDTPTGVGQFGPHVVTGLQWIDDPTNDIILSNAFEATLTGADRVRLDLGRMGIDSAAPIAGTVSTNVPLTLRLDGDWASAPIVTVGGAAVETTLDDGVVTFTVPVGTDLAITVGEQTIEGAV